jgi:hypothetical protein
MHSLLDIAKQRPADFVIQRGGRPYLSRWYVVPRNPFANVYLHHFTQDDLDGALHDHPWDNMSVVLEGCYLEHTPHATHLRSKGDVVFRDAADAHRIQLLNGAPAWSMFSTGPKIRDWGFWCADRWVPWQEFVDPADSGKIGKGCGA